MMKRTIVHSLFIMLAIALCECKSMAQVNYTIEPVATGLNVPVKFVFATDGTGRIFYNELFTGNIKVIRGDSAQNGTWLHVNSNTELKRGLLGITLDPNFATNHYVYVFYTTDADTPANRVERYTEMNFRADTTSRLLLFEQSIATPCGIGFSHNGGCLVFGVDGKLYISLGENACASLATRTDDPRGKILRVEPDVPSPNNAVPTNPFYDDGDPFTGNDDRIFAKGLRNVFGMTLSLIDSTLYVTDNGPDCNDEVNSILSGRDYGWRPECYIGPTHCECSQDSPYTPPLWSSRDLRLAPTGMTVYNGTIYPELFGKVIFADAVQGYIRAGTFNQTRDSLDVNVISQPGVSGLYDLVTGPDGYIYFSHYSGIRRIKPLPTSVREDIITSTPGLMQNYPNPFNPKTDIKWQMADFSYVRLKVYDVFGREVAILVDEKKSPGSYSVTWNANGQPSGIYFYRLTTPSFHDTQKMILLK